jgi:hypothetical protein
MLAADTTRERRMNLRLICPAVLALILSACAPPTAPASGAGAAKALAWDGSFDAGDKVRVKSRSGTFKPEETGHAAEVNVTPGKTGAVVTALGEIVRVRWDAQTWDEFPPTDKTVDLAAFEATIHHSFLQVAE